MDYKFPFRDIGCNLKDADGCFMAACASTATAQKIAETLNAVHVLTSRLSTAKPAKPEKPEVLMVEISYEKNSPEDRIIRYISTVTMTSLYGISQVTGYEINWLRPVMQRLHSKHPELLQRISNESENTLYAGKANLLKNWENLLVHAEPAKPDLLAGITNDVLLYGVLRYIAFNPGTTAQKIKISLCLDRDVHWLQLQLRYVCRDRPDLLFQARDSNENEYYHAMPVLQNYFVK